MARAGTPDLTRLDQGVHAVFDDIVLGGALKDLGMPQWDDVLSKSDAHDIHAYLIKLSRDAYEADRTASAPHSPAEVRSH
jgi:quinohemoprotein ethanol dehydrogenase